MKWILPFLMIVSMVTGQEPPEGQPEPRRRPNQGEAWKRRSDAALETLKKEDPAAYERLIKLKESDRRQYYRELMKLVKPDGDHGDGDRHPEGRRRGPRHGGKEAREYFTNRFLEHLKKTDPKRAQELQELLRTNPEKGREEIRKILASFQRKHFSRGGDEKVDKIVTRYGEASDEKKPAIEKELREAVEESFEKRMQMKQRELDYMKKRIESLEAALKKYRDSKDDLCDKRVADILRHMNGTDKKGGDGSDDKPHDVAPDDARREPRPGRRPPPHHRDGAAE